MTRLRLAPYDLASQGCRDLALTLNCKRIKPSGSHYRYRMGDVIINWGRSDLLIPRVSREAYYGHSSRFRIPRILNLPEAVRNAVDKQTAYRLFRSSGVPTVDSTTDSNEAESWLRSGSSVYCRRLAGGSRGRGITVLRPDADEEDIRRHLFGNTLFFTKRFPTKREFRIHVVGSSATLVSEKKRRNGTHPDFFIRSHDGWVFCRDNLEPYPSQIIDNSVAAVKALGLDFGGVDIALDKNYNTCVLEVNTAPGLCGIALVTFAAGLQEEITRRDW